MGDVSMRQTKDEGEAADPHERDLIVKYLSYALEDVRAVSETGLHLLQMTIAALSNEAAAEISNQEPPVVSCH